MPLAGATAGRGEQRPLMVSHVPLGVVRPPVSTAEGTAAVCVSGRGYRLPSTFPCVRPPAVSGRVPVAPLKRAAQIVRLHAEQRMNFAEIAPELRKTSCAVQNQYQRAIQKLRKHFDLPEKRGVKPLTLRTFKLVDFDKHVSLTWRRSDSCPRLTRCSPVSPLHGFSFCTYNVNTLSKERERSTASWRRNEWSS